MGRRHRPGPTPASPPDYGTDPLFGVFRSGRRVYLPPADRPGVIREDAERMAAALGPDAVVVEVFTPDGGER